MVAVLVNTALFLLLEGAAVWMIFNNSIVQRNKMAEGLYAVTASVNNASDGITEYFSLGRVNERLSQENALLREENERLRNRMEERDLHHDSVFADKGGFRYIPAKVISNSTDRLHNFIVIDKGTEDGITEEMGVITDKGVVGIVITAGRNYSRVSSLLNTDNTVSALISGSNTFGTVSWDGKSIKEVILHDIPIHTLFSEGDTITTSGFSAIYPDGHPLGRIAGKEMGDGVNYEIRVELFENFKELKYIYVAVPSADPELADMIKKEEE